MAEMRYSIGKKVTAWILTCGLVITLIPELAFATQNGEQNARTGDEKIVEKNENITIYDIGDGKLKSLFYGGEIRFKDDSDKLSDYDPSLVAINEGGKAADMDMLDGYAYRNKSGNKKQYMPKRLSAETPVLMEYGKYRIEIVPSSESLESMELVDCDVQVSGEKKENLYGNKKEMPLNAVYESSSNECSLKFVSGENGIIETLNIGRETEISILEYRLDLVNLEAKQNASDKGIILCDEKSGDIVASISEPYIHADSDELHKCSAAYSLKEENDTYILAVTVSEDYLSGEKIEYPLAVDTEITWNTSGQFTDTYVLNGEAKNDNFHNSSNVMLPVGKDDEGTYESYISFSDLEYYVRGKEIKSSLLTVYEAVSCGDKQKISLHKVDSEWDVEGISYSDKPKSSASKIDSIKTEQVEGTAHTFDVTGFVKEIAESDAENYGFVLKNTGNTSGYTAFYGSQSASLEYQPVLEITYVEEDSEEKSAAIPSSYSLQEENNADTTAPTYENISFKDSQEESINNKATGEINPIIEFTGITDESISMTCISYALIAYGSQPAGTDYKTPAELTINNTKPYSGSFRLTAADRTIPTGEYALHVRITDDAGNITTKIFKYIKDITDPEGSVIITDLVTGNQTYQIYEPVNIEVGVSGTGSDIAESTLKLYKAATNSAGDVTGIIADTEKIIRKNFTISENVVMDTTDICDSYGTYRLILYLKDSVGRTKEVTTDFEVIYTLPAPYEAKISHSTGETATLTWGFNYAPQQKIKLASIEGYIGNTGTFSQMVSPGENGTLPFEGSATITVPAEEGVYNITLRGVAKDGHAGMDVTVPCIVDKTAPAVNLTDFNQGYLKGSILDDNIKEWNVYAKEKSAAAYGEEALFTKGHEVDNWLISFHDLTQPPFEAGKEYTLKVVAEDKAGNTSSDTIDITVPTDNTIARSIPPQLTIERGERYASSQNFIVGTSPQTLSIKENVSNVQWYINNRLTSPALAISDYGPVYKDCWNDVLAMAIEADGSRKYSTYITENGLKLPITFEAGEVQGQVGTKDVWLDQNVVGFKIKAQPGVATYQIMPYVTTDEDYVTVLPDTMYYIRDITTESVFCQGFRIKATAASGKTVNDAQTVMYFDTTANESFYCTDVENYAPENLRVEDKINHKTYLKWDIPENLPESITYEVYRSTEEEFTADENTLVASELRTGYFTEVNAVHGKTFYYKVRAREVKVNEFGWETINYSSFTTVKAGRTVDLNESLKHLGMKEFWGFTEFNTPNGNGYIEKSNGNFLYQQTDAELPNEGFDVKLTRAYNSQSSWQGTFGFGWSHEYDIELLNICEESDLTFTHVILKDGNGTIYHFTRESGERYFVSSLGNYVNLTAENTEKTKTVNISGDENNQVTELKYQFVLSTKDGVVYYFNSGGQLILMEDSNSKFVLFQHDANNGVLSRMVTNNNIAIEFTYNDGKGDTDPLTIKEISMPDGSKVQYEYTKPLLSSEQLLTKVTKVSENEAIEYEYEYDKPFLSSQPRNLTVIKEAQNKNQYKINYDFETDQVKEVIYPNNEKFTFTYAPDNTCTVTKKYSGGQAVLGEKDFFDRITGACEKSIRGVTDMEVLDGTNETGLDVTTYEYRDHLLVSSDTTAEYYEVNTDGYVVEKSGIRTKSAAYSGDNPTKEIEEDGAVSEYTYYTETDGAHLDDLIKTVKETNASGKLASYKKYTYDTAGNVTEVVDFAEKTKITNSYYTEGAFKGELHTMKEYLITVTGTDQIASESLKSTSVYSYQYTTSDGVTTKTESCTQTIPKTDGTNEVITTSTQYDLMGRVLKETDSRGYQTINTYDGFGRVTGTTYKYSDSDQLKQQTQTSYDKNGMIAYEKLENGIEKWYTYDNMGRVVSTRVKKDTIDETINTTYRYEDVNIYQGKGTETVTINNAYVTKQAYSDGTVISEIYEDHCGNVVRAYEGGLYTDMTYSSQGDMITKWCMGQTLSATEGILEIYIYDEQGNLTESIADPDYVTGTNTTGYYVRPDSTDEEGNPVQGSIVNKSRYDEDGNVIEQIDPLGNTTKYTYDKNGSLLSVLLPDQAKYEYQYDVEGANNTSMDIVLEPRVTGTESDRLMSKSIVVKDSTDKTIKVEDLGTSDSDNTSISTTYEYDVRDNLIKATEKNGNYKSYTYDTRDRVTAIDYYEMSGSSAAKTLRTEFTYDDADNLTVMVDKEIVSGEEVIYRYTAYGYDGLNRLIWVSENDTDTVPAETAINANKVSYGYDGKDRLVSIDYANSNNGVNGLRFTYNTHGWLTKVDAVNANNAEKTLREYTYADDGMVSVITDYTDFLSGTNKWLKRTYTYDKFNRVTALDYTDNMTGSSTDIKETYSYEYDKNNNIISEVRQNSYGTANGADYQETYAYSYDANNRLIFNNCYKMETSAIGGDHAEVTYNYDAAGNKISEEVFKSGATGSRTYESTYTYNEFNQLTRAYEENPDTTRIYTYTYDQNGNQTSKTTINPYTEAQMGQSTYTYDAANRLKTATGTTGETVDYTQENKYNGFGQRVEKKEGTDVTNYFYDGTAVLYTTDAEGSKTSFNLIGAEDNILSTLRIGADNQADFYVYTKDIRESTTNVLGSDGLAEVSYTYDEYGETTEYQQDEDNPFYNEICYTAGVYDATTGLYNLNARYYTSLPSENFAKQRSEL